MDKTVYIANGAGFSGDRFDAAVPLVAQLASCSGPRYLMFEVLAERTIAIAQIAREKDPASGYSPYLENYLRPILADVQKHQIKIISNMGAANPAAAARHIHKLAKEMGLAPFKIAILKGDDVTPYLDRQTIMEAETMEGTSLAGRTLSAANAYLGGDAVAEVLKTGADIVLVGRTTDSALVLGPLIHEFGWTESELDKLATGTICGHLLECGAQVTGAYFADPDFKDVPDLAEVGFPLAEVQSDGHFVITKAEGTGGCVTKATVTEQLLYEMHDPSCYLVPDVSADVSAMKLSEDGPDRIAVSGIKGHKRPDKLKVTVCIDGGYMAEAEMTYAGLNAFKRARLAGEVVLKRMRAKGYNGDIRMDILGAYSVLDGGKAERIEGKNLPFDSDYRVRLALVSGDRQTAQLLCDELGHLYCSGPAGGGGYRASVTEQMASASILLDRELIAPHIQAEVISHD